MKKTFVIWITGVVGAAMSSLGIAYASAGFCLSCIAVPLSAILGIIGISMAGINTTFLWLGLALLGISLYIMMNQKKCKRGKHK